MHLPKLKADQVDPAFLRGLSRSWVASVCAAAGAVILLASCSSTPQVSDNWVENLDNSDPQVRLEAIWRAARDRETAAIPKLIALLDDDEVSIRFAANSALEKMTEADMEYRAYDTPQARK
ncbi:MAG: HEAT repeat domain-containing protein, partial [Planctomycetota bacterium]|nr:HEAT repeat domain-containing protein [Planctomycetota bacterium]